MSFYLDHEGTELGAFDTAAIGEGYVVTAPDGSPLIDAAAPVRLPTLGHGGFGTVVRATFKGLPRAVKFVDPAGLIRSTPDPHRTSYYSPGHKPTPADLGVLATHVASEIVNANSRSFKNVNPIVDFGSVTDRLGRRLSYYASPFIAGFTFLEFFKQPQFSQPDSKLRTDRQLRHHLHDTLLSVVDDLLTGLTELEDAQVSHLDIKPQNLMILPATHRPSPTAVSRDRLFLIDLGCAVSQKSNTSRVPLFRTNYFFPTDFLKMLSYDRGYVAHAALAKLGPKIDLYAVGRTLELLMCDRVRRGSPGFIPAGDLRRSDPIKESLWRIVFEDEYFDVIEGLIDRLMDVSDEGFATAADAQSSFQAVARRSSTLPLASRVLTDAKRGLKIHVASNTVRVAPPFDKVVNHPAFQRLRRLQQLTLVSQTYPDATHTRFAHSLNTFHLAKRFVMALARETRFRLTFTPRDTEQVLLAALLHDLGQYPFTHTIEDLRKLGLKSIQHDQEIAVRYLDRRDGAKKSIRELLEGDGYSVSDISYMFAKTAKDVTARKALNIGRDLVSGTVDVDRVAYLLQDSDRTGVPYGGSIDVDELVEALCIHDPKGGPPSLGVDESGISAVEGILAAVYWMYRNVYWTPANRGFMAAVKYVFSALVEADKITFDKYADRAYGMSEWEAMMLLDTEFASLQKTMGPHYRPLQSLLTNQRFSYERVFSLGDASNGDGLYTSLMKKASPPLLKEIVEAIEGKLPKETKVLPGEILIDVPLKPRIEKPSTENAETQSEAGTRPPLWVRRQRTFTSEATDWKLLEECSPFANSIALVERTDGRKIRVFFSNELIERLPNARSCEKLITDAITDKLKDAQASQPQ